MEISITDAPPRFDKREHNWKYAVTHPRRDRAGQTKADKDAAYLSRKIVAIDGEGLNVRRGKRRGEHDYVMLALTDVDPLIDKNGLSTEAILQYLHSNLSSVDLNVIYGGSYDFNCWCADMTADEVRTLYNSPMQGRMMMWNGWGLRWVKGKSFTIYRDKKTVTINDVVSFFQRPFIGACDEYLGEYEGRDVLVREKARRGSFTVAELATIGSYNNLELELLVKLMTEFRLRLDRVGLRPKLWNSPGAIASALFIREGVKKHRNEELPAPVQEAARYAYAGGRFEMVKYGASPLPAYEYDINSAYPRALCEVPSLQGGKWIHWKRRGPMPKSAFALYHVRFQNKNADYIHVPAPLFHRAENGTISYPTYSANWVWTPEYEMLQEYCDTIPGASFFVLEAWLFIPESDVKPFGFIPALYKMRQALKRSGDGAHVGIKLALNSMYGKTAQQVGYAEDDSERGYRVPSYHQLEWAGYVTSWCRATVLRAALQNPSAIIAFETDALFSSEPLDLDIGEGLGQWEETRFESLTYVQSGHYYGTKIEKGQRVEVVKCRGIDKGEVTREMVEAQLAQPFEADRTLEAPLTRFYGAGIALARDFSKVWRKWLTETKRLRLYPVGKREHGACWCEGSPFARSAVGDWHQTYCPIFGTHSHEYPVAWINPNPAMTELAELREGENVFDYDE